MKYNFNRVIFDLLDSVNKNCIYLKFVTMDMNLFNSEERPPHLSPNLATEITVWSMVGSIDTELFEELRSYKLHANYKGDFFAFVPESFPEPDIIPETFRQASEVTGLFPTEEGGPTTTLIVPFNSAKTAGKCIETGKKILVELLSDLDEFEGLIANRFVLSLLYQNYGMSSSVAVAEGISSYYGQMITPNSVINNPGVWRGVEYITNLLRNRIFLQTESIFSISSAQLASGSEILNDSSLYLFYKSLGGYFMPFLKNVLTLDLIMFYEACCHYSSRTQEEIILSALERLGLKPQEIEYEFIEYLNKCIQKTDAHTDLISSVRDLEPNQS